MNIEELIERALPGAAGDSLDKALLAAHPADIAHRLVAGKRPGRRPHRRLNAAARLQAQAAAGDHPVDIKFNAAKQVDDIFKSTVV